MTEDSVAARSQNVDNTDEVMRLLNTLLAEQKKPLLKRLNPSPQVCEARRTLKGYIDPQSSYYPAVLLLINDEKYRKLLLELSREI